MFIVLILPFQLLIPVENFLTPDETDIELLQLYLSALCARAVLPEWSPVLYLLAVHHINRWLYHLAALPDHKDAQSRMWTQLLANHDKVCLPNQLIREYDLLLLF